MPLMTIVEAVNDALGVALDQDERVLVVGEDVGRTGGVFRATNGLIERFGARRVVDAPLAEASIVGTAVGLSAYGLHPIVEMQFLGFSFQAFAQIATQAAKLRWRSQGRFSCPLVIRAPFGAGVRAPEIHSEALEAHFVHVPGLKVVCPASPYDAKGLLLAALDDPDPVLFLEPLRIYRAGRAEVPSGHYTVPLGSAAVVRTGRHISLFAWSAMVPVALAAADSLAAEGIEAEVIDLRTLSPLDTATIIASVEKTGRAVVVHEAIQTAGLGAEIVAIINERALLALEAPVARVTSYDVHLPHPLLEDYFVPVPSRVVEAARQTLNF